MANYSDIFSLGVGGGTTNLAGVEWVKKTEDFIANVGSGYECDTTTGDIICTLPESPTNNSEIKVLKLGSNKLHLLPGDPFNSVILATDYTKTINQNEFILTLNFQGASVGWQSNIVWNQFLGNGYIGSTLTLSYTNSSTFNGFYDYTGTLGLQQSWSNPVSTNRITITHTGAFASGYSTTNYPNVVDKNDSTMLNFYGTDNTIVFNNQTYKIKANKAIVSVYKNPDLLVTNYIDGSNDGVIWVPVSSAFTTSTGGSYTTVTFTPDLISDEYYQYYRVRQSLPSSRPVGIGEFELFGEILV